MPMLLVALDVETANSRRLSICQIGLVVFDDRGVELAAEKIFVDPCEPFDPFNISIHGIDAATVAGAPSIRDLSGWLAERLDGRIVASHSRFDLDATGQALARHGLELPDCLWVDTARVARRAWPGAPDGYALDKVARRLGITLQHHDALENARTSGHVLIRAVRETDIRLADCLLDIGAISFDPADQMTTAKRDTAKRDYVERETRIDVRRPPGAWGPLNGETVVFSGSLGIERGIAADFAHAAGAAVDQGVTRRTTILVVGSQNPDLLAGKDKSAKQIKAEELIAKGQKLRILNEREFVGLAARGGSVVPRAGRGKVDTGFPPASRSTLMESITSHDLGPSRSKIIVI
jgi:DNA polymerase-3 subunit epsilon